MSKQWSVAGAIRLWWPHPWDISTEFAWMLLWIRPRMAGSGMSVSVTWQPHAARASPSTPVPLPSSKTLLPQPATQIGHDLGSDQELETSGERLLLVLPTRPSLWPITSAIMLEQGHTCRFIIELYNSWGGGLHSDHNNNTLPATPISGWVAIVSSCFKRRHLCSWGGKRTSSLSINHLNWSKKKSSKKGGGGVFVRVFEKAARHWGVTTAKHHTHHYLFNKLVILDFY